MLNRVKRLALGTIKASRAFRVVSRSRWRQAQLLILGYHGVSQEDEHLWNPSLYMSVDHFSQRMKALKRLGCNVLPLGEAIERLYAGTLPELSVVLTFDDGSYDFYKQAYPIIKEYNFPVTVYLTTFYSRFNRPVFTTACSYLLWKAKDKTLNLKALAGEDARVDTSTQEARVAAVRRLTDFAERNNLTAEEKDSLVIRLAEQINVDCEPMLTKRLLHIMSPGVISQLASDGVDFQLHTHRHRMPSDRTLFLREIEENSASIRQMTGITASHLCYPSGIYGSEFIPWLKDVGIVSATTCDSGLASDKSNPHLMPRVIDTSNLSLTEFEGWVSGVSGILPRRPSYLSIVIPTQIIDMM